MEDGASWKIEMELTEDLFGDFVPEEGGGLDAVQCKKKSSHENFIRVSDFKLQDLPQEYQEEEIYKRILTWAELTVKVLVKFVSHSRPETYAGTTAKFPNFEIRGSKRKKTPGSGYIHSIPPEEDIDWTKECHCLSCLEQGKPQTQSWYFTIVTSIHVVFDSSEAERSIFECFYDSDDTRSETVKRLYGICIYPQTACDNEKMSFVVCVTHDEGLATRLRDLVKKRKKFVKDSTAASTGPTVLISHPHGCSKRITCGRALHFTIPPGLEHNYPVNKPVAFEGETECIIPYGALSQDLMADFAKAHGIDPNNLLPSDATDLNTVSKPTTEIDKPSVDREDEDASSTFKHAPPQHSINQAFLDTTAAADTQSSSDDKSSCHESSGHSPPRLSSSAVKWDVKCDEKRSSSLPCVEENLDLKAMIDKLIPENLNEPCSENSSSSSHLSAAMESSTTPHIPHTLHSEPAQKLVLNDTEAENKNALCEEIIPDNSDTADSTELFCLYSIDDALSESQKDSLPPPNHLISLALPSKMTFTLPEDAKFARRYDDMKALFQLPPATRFHLADGKEVKIPAEALFYCNRVTLENGYMRYKVVSCPGSSGGCLMLDGGNSFFNTLPHGGSLPDGCSLCAMRCFPVLPSAL